MVPGRRAASGMNEGRPLQALEVIPQLDGEHVYLVSKFPIAEQNAEELVLGGICVDVTEQQKAEKLEDILNDVLTNTEKLDGLRKTTEEK